MTDLIFAPSLKRMKLSSNPLRHLFTGHSRALPLQVLDLSNTHLETFDGASFPSLQHLQKLDLSGSLLTVIGGGGLKVSNS
jgi:Leucine-rich repeat (LRR) protein